MSEGKSSERLGASPPAAIGRGYNAAFTLGVQLAAGMFICVWAGYYLGHKLGYPKVGTLAGGCLGFAYTLYETWKKVRGLNRPAAPSAGGP